MPQKLTDEDLNAILDAEIHEAESAQTEIAKERENSLSYYLGEPFGDEIEGRSKVVSTDVMDTIEWILPSLVRVFLSTDTVAFDPTGEGDEEQAEQETDMVNYVFNKENNGFIILYNWFKDALLQKNGVVKVYWDETEESATETYLSQDDAEFTALMDDPELTPIEHTESTEVRSVMTQAGIAVEEGFTVHDTKFKRVSKKGKVRVDNVPPEEFIVSSKARSLVPNDIPFVCHKVKKMVSDLVQQGFEFEMLDDLSSDSGIDGETQTRYDDMGGTDNDSGLGDRSRRELEVEECYPLVDMDGDGIAERRLAIRIGKKIIENEEIDRVPFAALCPIPLTHRYYGLSLSDLVMDLQRIKSALYRQTLDNMYNSNNQRIGVWDGKVNLDDLLVSRPSGVVRFNTNPNEAMAPIPVLPIGDQAYKMLEYTDQVKENRTGVSDQTQGLNADVLANANIPAVQQLANAANARIELIARIFAETGVKDLMLQIHELLLKHQDKEKVIKLRDKWVPIDPRSWRTRENMTVNVGLGTGSKEVQINTLAALWVMQKEGMELGIATPDNLHATAERMTELSGFKDTSRYFTSPEKIPPREPPPDPTLVAIDATMKAEMANLQFKNQEMMSKHMLELQKIQQKNEEIANNFATKMTELELKFDQNVPGSAV